MGGGIKASIETPPISLAAHPPFLPPSFQKVNFPSASKSPLSDNEARSIFIYKGHVGGKMHSLIYIPTFSKKCFVQKYLKT